MPEITLRGVDHYYEWVRSDSGSDISKSASKPVMVFLHGWGGSARYWHSTAAALSDYFDCLLYDMRGFGRSRLPQPPLAALEASYELETYAEDLAQLLDTLGLGLVYLNAHSTGTSIATFFLNLYPERVIKAVLTCGGIFDYDERAFNQFHQFGTYVVKFRPRWLAKIPQMDRMFMARFLHRPIPGIIRKAFLEDFLMADYDAALGTMLTAVSKKAAEIMPAEFAQLKVPTLLISGEHDLIIPAQMGRQAADLNQNIQYVVIPETAHFPMLEDPSFYLKCVREFLQISPTLESSTSA